MAAPDCRLYLVMPPKLDPQVVAADLGAALDAGDVACVELALDTADQGAWRSAIAALRPVAQRRDVAFLLRDRPELAAETGCDGVVTGPGHAFEAARRVIGSGAIVGVAIDPASETARHDAMLAAELGADFVGFGTFDGPPPIELIEWWAELMESPCVAYGVATPADSDEMVPAGADFIAVREAVWDHPDGPAAGLRQIAAVMLAT